MEVYLVPNLEVEAIPQLATTAFVAISKVSLTRRFFRATRGRHKLTLTAAVIVTTLDSVVSAPPH